MVAVCAFVSAARDQSSDLKRPLITGVAHIAFQVGDLAKARAFYGELLGYDEAFQVSEPAGSPALTCFKVNERQYIEIIPGLPAGMDERLSHIAFETNDLEALRAYLLSKGVKAPGKVNQGADGNLNFAVTDPDGHRVEFVGYRDGSLSRRAKGRYVSGRRISDRILHVGLTVADQASADKFYKDILGFSEIWRGGRDDASINWINMRVPALLVPDIQKALETARERVNDPASIRSPQVGRNRRWQLNLFDPDGSRAELMEPFPIK
jgi:lactoylglutathione lyase